MNNEIKDDTIEEKACCDNCKNYKNMCEKNYITIVNPKKHICVSWELRKKQ